MMKQTVGQKQKQIYNLQITTIFPSDMPMRLDVGTVLTTATVLATLSLTFRAVTQSLVKFTK